VSNPSDRPAVTGNSFLDSLADATRARLAPLLTEEHMRKGHVIAEPGVPIEKIYFPLRSLLSTLTRMKDGGAVEVGLAGHEGMGAISVVFGSRETPHTTVVQVQDTAYSMSAGVFLDEMKSDGHLRARSLAYAEYSFAAATQFAACNRLHPIEERLARWMLMAVDRVGSPEFVMTQEYLAQMLGVRRAGVTTAAGAMSNAGLITYRRGHLAVLDREGLEETSCECYGVVNAELRRLMGYGARQTRIANLTEKRPGGST
jgi:CRP-like cAMP-binding protein